METKKSVYFCDCCDYYTEIHQSIKKHITTEKHKFNANNNSYQCYECDINKKVFIYLCKNCGKHFKFLSTKKKHQLKCNKNNKNTFYR